MSWEFLTAFNDRVAAMSALQLRMFYIEFFGLFYQRLFSPQFFGFAAWAVSVIKQLRAILNK